MVTKHIAIILARGGSKRLPRKNILDFFGRPMIAWTIEAALQSEIYERVLVSTDDDEIAKIARDYGAEAPFLRNSAADDLSSSSEATIVALLQAESYWGEKFDVVSQLMANCPLRGSIDVIDANKNFTRMNCSSQISSFRFGWMNPWWSIKIDESGRPDYLFPEALNKRSQDLPPLYCPSGAIWIARSSELKSKRSFYMPGHLFHAMPWISSLDIDDADDLEMGKACYLIKNSMIKM